MSGIMVRKLTLQDAEQAASIHVQTWHDSFTDLMPAKNLEVMTLPMMIPRWQNIIGVNKANLILLGAFEGDRLLAVLGAGTPREKNGYDCEIWSMSVPLTSQRRGLGRKLFEASIQDLWRAGHRNMYLYCIDENIKALDFYRSMGGNITSLHMEREGYAEVLVVWESLEGLAATL